MGAQFAYLLETAALKGWHWNNDGLVEDVAIGSAAGCVAAYLRRQERLGDAGTATLSRAGSSAVPARSPSGRTAPARTSPPVEVGGDVCLSARAP
jgi:trans-2,3-dihydro-3-hydroxyanthranilate isomerase